MGLNGGINIIHRIGMAEITKKIIHCCKDARSRDSREGKAPITFSQGRLRKEPCVQKES